MRCTATVSCVSTLTKSTAIVSVPTSFLSIFFFNDTATTEIYTLSLHDALPISNLLLVLGVAILLGGEGRLDRFSLLRDRKSTRLNSSHVSISYAVFCLKKKSDMAMLILLDVFQRTCWMKPAAYWPIAL